MTAQCARMTARRARMTAQPVEVITQPKFRRYTVDIHGAAGEAWLARLPELLAMWAERWALTLLPPFADLSFHYVAPAVRVDGTQVVLKATVPNAEQRCEAAALAYAGGQGLVRLVDADLDEGVFLMARVLPGTPLSLVEDEQALTRTAVEVLRALWRPVAADHPFTTLAAWAAGLRTLHATFADGYGPFPRVLVDRAEGLFRDLLSGTTPPVLLHGDLHPQNVLWDAGGGWLAIDPKGVVGDPAYDVADFVVSIPRTDDMAYARQLVTRRAALAGELLGWERDVILGWAQALCVLSGWWSYEDHGGGWEYAFALAEAIGR